MSATCIQNVFYPFNCVFPPPPLPSAHLYSLDVYKIFLFGQVSTLFVIGDNQLPLPIKYLLSA